MGTQSTWGCSSEFFSEQTTWILTMKFLIIASLVAFVAAEAESAPALLYHHGGPHLTNGFVHYPNGAVVPQDTASVQVAKGLHLNAKALVPPYHFLPKAAVVPSVAIPVTKTINDDAVTKTDVDTQKVITYATPTYPFYSGYPYVAPYGAYPYTTTHTGVAPVYTTPYTTTHTGVAPVYTTTPYHHLIKREAEAEAEADPALVYHHGGPHLTAPHNYQYGYPAYPYGYPTTMGYPYKYPTTYGAYPYKYPTTFGAYPYTTPYTGVAPVTTPYTGVAPIYTAPLTHTITPASTTKLIPKVMPLAPN